MTWLYHKDMYRLGFCAGFGVGLAFVWESKFTWFWGLCVGSKLTWFTWGIERELF